MTLKELADADIGAVFLSIDDFADEHEVDGAVVTCVLDSDAGTERDPMVGSVTAGVRMFARADELPRRLSAGDSMIVDGMPYLVTEWREDMGMAQVSLSGTRTY